MVLLKGWIRIRSISVTIRSSAGERTPGPQKTRAYVILPGTLSYIMDVTKKVFREIKYCGIKHGSKKIFENVLYNPREQKKFNFDICPNEPGYGCGSRAKVSISPHN